MKEIAQISAKTIHLRINSPGGDVFDARAIKTALEQHPAKVISHIDGLAASAASFVMLAGDEIEMARGSMVMIHKAWAIAIGNADDMLTMADLLDKVDGQIAADYVRATGQKREQIDQWMAEETWFTEDEALEHGFIDRIYEGDAVESRFDLSAFKNAPKTLTERRKAPSDDEIAAQMKAAADARLALYERTAP